MTTTEGAVLGTAGCAGASALLLPPLALPFTVGPMMAAAFVLGVTTQGAKIATDTVVQTTVDDAFRGRVFSLYDVAFNVAFVGAAAASALVLPPDGRSPTVVLALTVVYAAVATSISGCTAKNEPTVTIRQTSTPALSTTSRGGEPPAGASCISARSRKYIARTIPR